MQYLGIYAKNSDSKPEAVNAATLSTNHLETSANTAVAHLKLNNGKRGHSSTIAEQSEQLY